MEQQEYIPGHEADAVKSGEIKIDDSCLQKIPDLDCDPKYSQQAVARLEVMDYGDECFLLKNLITSGECQHYIKEGERLGFGAIGYARDDYRSSQRISFRSPQLVSVLWQRLQGFLKEIVITGDPHDRHIEGPKFLLQGTWIPKGLNDIFRLCRYKPGGHFAPHNDGFFVCSSTERSLQTFMLYLNGDFSGGSTNFIDPSQRLFKDADGKFCAEKENILCRIQPEGGLAIIFNHNRLHEGEKVIDGQKYILRTDIMFENTTPSSLSANQDKAMRLLQEADRLESSGECMKAMELYRKAFKLSPELAESYGGAS